MTERERWEKLLSQDIPVMVKAPFTGEPMCIDLLQFGTTELESFINFLVSHGAILPPVTVGQTVYYIVGGYYRSPENCKVSDPCKVVEISYKQQTRNTKTGTELRLLAGFITDNGTRYSFDGIGKTVFLTREEAEAELEKRRKEVNTT